MAKLTKAARNLAPGQILCKRCAGSGFWVEKDQMCFRCQGDGVEMEAHSPQILRSGDQQ